MSHRNIWQMPYVSLPSKRLSVAFRTDTVTGSYTPEAAFARLLDNSVPDTWGQRRRTTS